jgi:membrane protein insertase Oxa1/YidC/SpoIIIJ
MKYAVLPAFMLQPQGFLPAATFKQKAILDVFERVYYTRAVHGIIAGIIAGLVIPLDHDQGTSVGIALLLAIVMYIISYAVGKKMAGGVPQDKRRKIATEGIVPFIFMTIVFMVLVYTGLHQSVLLPQHQ